MDDSSRSTTASARNNAWSWIADVVSRKLMPFLKNRFRAMGSGFRAGWQADRVCVRGIGPAGGLCSVVRIRAIAARGRRAGARFPGTAPGWCAGERTAASCFTWAWTMSLYAVPVDGPLEFGEPKSLFRIAGAHAIRHHQGLSIRCLAGRPAVCHADNRFRAAASVHRNRELAGQISPLGASGID